MADGDAPVAARVAPFQRYYLCIDGTGSADSVEYGKLLEEKFGWRNLLGEFLERAAPVSAADNDRLHDPNHPFLPICTFASQGRKKPIAIVCPGGRDGKGIDAFWDNYIGETPQEQANQGQHTFVKGSGETFTTFGRHTATTKSIIFMNELILAPAIEKITDAAGKPLAQIRHGLLPGSRKPTEPDVPAEFLLISSHGWLGGFMRGNKMQPSASAQPKAAQDEFKPPPRYFLLGRAVAQGRFFVGPKWIVLAQCSTINNATWAMWAKLMAAGVPPVRGILGYEEVSPDVGGSIAIARTFFDLLKQGQPLLKAWRTTNKNEKWAAIVHKEALSDLMSDWDVFKDLTEVKITASQGSYLAFGASLERGKEKLTSGKTVLDEPPPFGMKLERIIPAEPNATPPVPEIALEITPDTLDDSRRAWFDPDFLYRMTITPPASAPGARIAGAAIKWVHIREHHEPNPPSIAALFQKFAEVPSGSLSLTVSSNDARVLNVKPATGPTPSIVIEWTSQTKKVLESSTVMEHHHSLIWPLIRVEVVGGPHPEESFPFSTQGLLF